MLRVLIAAGVLNHDQDIGFLKQKFITTEDEESVLRANHEIYDDVGRIGLNFGMPIYTCAVYILASGGLESCR